MASPFTPPCGIAAEEYDHLCDFTRLQYPVLRVDGGALGPDFFDAYTATLGLGACRAFGHCRSHPARQHGVGRDSEWTCILGDRARKSNNPML